jgi:hypothetical protein
VVRRIVDAVGGRFSATDDLLEPVSLTKGNEQFPGIPTNISERMYA